MELGFVPAKWDVKTNAAGVKTERGVGYSGHVDVPGRKLQSIKIQPADFSCKAQDNSIFRIDQVQIEGYADPLRQSGSTNMFTIDALVSLLGIPPVNDDIAQADKKSCSISGSVRIESTDLAGQNPVTSDPISFQTNLVHYPNMLVAPASPKPAVVTRNRQATLSWTPSNGARSYTIYRATSQGAEVEVKRDLTATEYIDNGLTNGIPYYYQVTAVNAVGESGRSVEISGIPQPPPPAPPMLAVSSVGNGQVSLSWAGVPGAVAYKVYRGTSSGTEVELKTGVTGTSYTDANLNNDVTYYYQVSALSSSGEGARSIEITGKPHS